MRERWQVEKSCRRSTQSRCLNDGALALRGILGNKQNEAANKQQTRKQSGLERPGRGVKPFHEAHCRFLYMDTVLRHILVISGFCLHILAEWCWYARGRSNELEATCRRCHWRCCRYLDEYCHQCSSSSQRPLLHIWSSWCVSTGKFCLFVALFTTIQTNNKSAQQTVYKKYWQAATFRGKRKHKVRHQFSKFDHLKVSA